MTQSYLWEEIVREAGEMEHHTHLSYRELADLPVQQFNTFTGGNEKHLCIKGTCIKSFSRYLLNVCANIFIGCTLEHMSPQSPENNNVPK
jgi:hypothetical protein